MDCSGDVTNDYVHYHLICQLFFSCLVCKIAENKGNVLLCSHVQKFSDVFTCSDSLTDSHKLPTYSLYVLRINQFILLLIKYLTLEMQL